MSVFSDFYDRFGKHIALVLLLILYSVLGAWMFIELEVEKLLIFLQIL
jgi:hypothetical protein